MTVRKNRKAKKWWGIDQGSVSVILKMILWISKGGIGRWKIVGKGERIFDGDCTGSCMHKGDCENERASTIL